jgi:hypothetical protein
MARERREVWEERVRQWRASGQSVKEFAAALGVHPVTLSGWRWRIESAQRKTGRKAAAPPAAEPVQFVELTGLAGAGTSAAQFELVLASGATVRVPSTFDAAALRRLLDVVERR